MHLTTPSQFLGLLWLPATLATELGLVWAGAPCSPLGTHMEPMMEWVEDVLYSQ